MKTFKDYLNENRVSEAYTSKTGKIVPKNLEELKKLVRLKRTNLANIDVSGFTDLSHLFYGSKRTDFSGIENWDVSHVHNMRGMFRDCSSFTGKDIPIMSSKINNGFKIADSSLIFGSQYDVSFSFNSSSFHVISLALIVYI